MSVLDATREMTVDEFLALPECEERMELVAGETIMSPKPTFDHQAALTEIAYLLRDRVGTNGWVVLEKEVVVRTPAGREQVRVPDLCYLRRSRGDIVTQEAIRGAPDIVVEILSQTTEEVDRIAKRDEYETSGVGEYWIVDVDVRAVLIHYFAEGRQALAKDQESFESEVLKSLGLPCRFSVAELFETLL